MNMALITYSPITSDWPCQVKTPGSFDWERSAVRWLRELVPTRYASYPALIKHPVLLARHAHGHDSEEDDERRHARASTY